MRGARGHHEDARRGCKLCTLVMRQRPPLPDGHFNSEGAQCITRRGDINLMRNRVRGSTTNEVITPCRLAYPNRMSGGRLLRPGASPTRSGALSLTSPLSTETHTKVTPIGRQKRLPRSHPDAAGAVAPPRSCASRCALHPLPCASRSPGTAPPDRPDVAAAIATSSALPSGRCAFTDRPQRGCVVGPGAWSRAGRRRRRWLPWLRRRR